MLLETKLTPQDYVAAQRVHFRPKPVLRGILYAILTFFGLVLLQEIWAIFTGSPLPQGWWLLPLGLAYAAFLFLILLPWRVARIFRSQPTLAEPVRTEIDENGLVLNTPRGQLRFRWASLKKWKRNRHYLLIYHSSLHFHIFPRRCFASPEEFAALVALLQKHLGPEQP